MKRIQKTSLEAYRKAHPDMIQEHHGRIMFAMRLLGIASSMEVIAKKAGMEKAQVGRRMGELVSEGLAHVDGIGLTSSYRRCNLYSLTKLGKEKDAKNSEVFTKDTLLPKNFQQHLF